MRDDGTRLKELLRECAALNTTDPLKQLEAGTRVWSYARSIAQEIGQPFQNPPTPGVMCSTVKGCPPNGVQEGRCPECSGRKDER